MATAPFELMTTGEMKDLCSAAFQAVPSDLPRWLAKQWLCQKGRIGEEITKIFLAGPFPDINWQLTCEKLGMKAEAEAISKLVLPPANPATWWVPMVEGVTSNRVVAGMRNLGVDYGLFDEDLDAAVPTHDRDPKNGSYVVGFRRTIEADEENANKSVIQLAEQKHAGITLPERLWLGAGFFVATGQHLDTKKITLCSGSRDGYGGVPYVDFRLDDRGVCVCWCFPGFSYGDLRSRSVQFPLP